ncbi:transferase [Trypanosoma cruzi]|nr:transferase [Trypanosoma cruzi]
MGVNEPRRPIGMPNRRELWASAWSIWISERRPAAPHSAASISRTVTVSAPVCVCPMTGICMAYALCKAEGKGRNLHWHVSAVIMRKLWTCLCGKAARLLRRSSIDWGYTF